MSEEVSNPKLQPVVPQHVLIPFILLVSCFALWGLANNMTDVLVAQFRKIFSLNDFQSGLVQTAFYGAYFCLALPAAIFIRRYSYKAGVLLGLGLFAVGAVMFLPSGKWLQYEYFLFSLFVLASGLSILETSANPYILTMGSPETATQRLNLAQSFNPVGSILGVVIGKFFILAGLHPVSENEREKMPAYLLEQIQREELEAVLGPYLAVAMVIIVVWLAIAFFPMPNCRSRNSGDSKWLDKKSFERLFRNRLFIKGVVGQFLYVGCQIGCWSYTIRYVMAQQGGTEAMASSYLLASIILLASSRFICTLLMNYVSPERLLTILAAVAATLLFMVILVGGKTGIYSLVLVSGCMSLMFPTIFGISLADSGDDVSLGGSCMIMAILGGAVLTALMGVVSDCWSISAAFVIPLIGFIYLVYFGRTASRLKIKLSSGSI